MCVFRGGTADNHRRSPPPPGPPPHTPSPPPPPLPLFEANFFSAPLAQQDLSLKKFPGAFGAGVGGTIGGGGVPAKPPSSLPIRPWGGGYLKGLLCVCVCGLGGGAPPRLPPSPNSMLKYTDVGVRLILIDGGGLEAAEFREHARKYPALELLREKGLYVFDAYNPGVSIAVHPGDLFMATLYYTAFTCDATIRRHPALRNRNFVYFIQDFEPIFFPHSAGYVTALETYRYPHFGIYSTPFLQRWYCRPPRTPPPCPLPADPTLVPGMHQKGRGLRGGPRGG